MRIRTISVWLSAGLLAGCQSAPGNAPVSDRKIVATESARPAPSIPPKRATDASGAAQKSSRADKDWRPDTYTVRRGDTLYAIALDHGLDYRELAAWNSIADPNRILAGQTLRMRAAAPSAAPSAVPVLAPEPAAVEVVSRSLNESPPPSGQTLPAELPIKIEPKAEKIPYSEVAQARIFGPQSEVDPELRKDEKPTPAPAPAARGSNPVDKEAVADTGKWTWPARGEVVATFDGARSKGISIAGSEGDPVLAANAGKVVYVGNAIQAYGHLVIVKHGQEYLTVYAHNATILVKEGQQVSAGQRIAAMGARPGAPPALHFEVRRLGRPVDPAKVLPTR